MAVRRRGATARDDGRPVVSGAVGLVLCAVCVAAAPLPWWCGARGRLLAVGERPGAARTPPDRADLGPVDVVVVLGLLDAAIASGAGLPRALGAVGRAVGGSDGAALERASAAIVMGAGWDVAWSGAEHRLDPVARCLAATWSTGAAPGPALRSAAEQLRRDRRTAAREAAARLGVRLVIPLGVCFLPAFVLVGLVPVMVSLGSALAR